MTQQVERTFLKLVCTACFISMFKTPAIMFFLFTGVCDVVQVGDVGAGVLRTSESRGGESRRDKGRRSERRGDDPGGRGDYD